MDIGPRKFYKMNGLTYIFKTYSGTPVTGIASDIYDTSVDGFNNQFKQNYILTGKVDIHTIMFITANEQDEGTYISTKIKDSSTPPEIKNTIYKKIHAGDTMIWARGDIYCVSAKNVSGISFDSQNRDLDIDYNDGTKESLSLASVNYTGEYPISIDPATNTVSLKDIYYDENGNLVLYTNPNEMDRNSSRGVSDFQNVFISGKGNYAVTDFQHIEGSYALIDSKYMFIIGNGTQTDPRNIFTVDFDGTGYFLSDVTAGGSPGAPAYKLSDIHSVLDADWQFVGAKYTDYISTEV